VVKLKSPLMSLDASGSVGKAITFSKWKGRNYVRKLVIPHNPQSGLQTGMRAWLTWLSKYWAVLSAGDKAVWAAYYPADSISSALGEILGSIRIQQTRLRQRKRPPAPTSRPPRQSRSTSPGLTPPEPTTRQP